MADPTMAFYQRLRSAIAVNNQEGRAFEVRVMGLHDYIRAQGVRGAHSTRATLRRWITGRGYPPDYWCFLAAQYLGVDPSCILPTALEREGPAAVEKKARALVHKSGHLSPHVVVPKERWVKETVYIVGGGPSAARYDLSQLHHHGIVIAVNDSAVGLSDADVVFTASPPWVRYRGSLIQRHRGQLVVRTAHTPYAINRWKLPPETIILPLRFAPGVSEVERKEGHNSGTEAIYWAAAQGARRIVLIGFDLETGKPQHWHGGYEWMSKERTTHDGKESYPIWATNMERVARDFKVAGVKCWNANPTSAIHAFPLTELDVPMIRRDGGLSSDSPLTCAVIIPVGPGHEEYSDNAVRSVVCSWEYDPGPFTHLWITRVWDGKGDLGCAEARNVGMNRTLADWHFLLDADDTMMKGAFALVDLKAPATFGAIVLDRRLSSENLWPVDRQVLRERGALGTLSMGCFVRGDLGLRFREGFPVGEDFDFYCRLPGFTKRQKALVNIGYRKPRAGSGEKNREAVGWLYACNDIIEQHLGPSKEPKPVRLNTITKAREIAAKG